MTPEYARIHGKMVNALMAVKQKLSQMVDETLGGLNMPTRRELRTLQDRLQESRRDYKALQVEVELLKEQMLSMRKPSAAAAPAPAASEPAVESAPVKKAAAKKKAGSKKKAAAGKQAES